MDNMLKLMTGVMLAVIIGVVGASIVTNMVNDATTTTARNDSLVFTAYGPTGEKSLSAIYNSGVNLSVMLTGGKVITFTNATHYKLFKGNSSIEAIDTSATDTYINTTGNETRAKYYSQAPGYITDPTVRTVINVAPILFVAMIIMVMVSVMVWKRE